MDVPRKYRVSSVRQLGAALRQARMDVGLTQEELSQRARVSRRWLIDAEKGHTPGLDVMRVMRVLRLAGKQLAIVPVLQPDPAEQAMSHARNGGLS